MALQALYNFESLDMTEPVYWDITYVSSEYGQSQTGSESAHTGLITEEFCRASRQYDSPLLNGVQGCGWQKLLYYSNDPDGSDSPNVLKIFKPVGATQIVIHGYYSQVDSQTGAITQVPTSITIDFPNNTIYASMVITIALSNSTALPEINEHISLAYQKVSKFKIRSHEFQINGSNFGVSQKDYLDPNKKTINEFQVRAIKNYCNIAMTRTFQKFLIGGYRNS